MIKQVKIGNIKLNYSLLSCLVLLSFSVLEGCSQYKSSWSCPTPTGIGCSSIMYADKEAYEDIVLNSTRRRIKVNLKRPQAINIIPKTKVRVGNKPKILIEEHYSGFDKIGRKEIELE